MVASSGKNVIFILLDALRADHFTPRNAPALFRCMSDASFFTSAYAASIWTLPSVSSMFTGLYPSRHQAITAHTRGELSARPLSSSCTTLAEHLSSQGFETVALSAFPLFSSHGLSRGFHHAFKMDTRVKAPAKDVVEETTRLLRTRPDQRLFLFLHFFDPHSPYDPPPIPGRRDALPAGCQERHFDPFAILQGKCGAPDRSYLRNVRRLYREEIRYVDHWLGVLFGELEDLRLFRNSVIVVTADHGESFGEHGQWGHGFGMYEEQVRVPLVVRCPDTRMRAKKVHDLVSTVTLFGSILKLLGLSPPPEAAPADIFERIVGGKDRDAPFAYAERFLPGGSLRMVRTDGRKYLTTMRIGEGTSEKREELYFLKSDPKETRNLIEVDPRAAQYMRGVYASFLRKIGSPEGMTAPIWDPTAYQEERLRDLGYT